MKLLRCLGVVGCLLLFALPCLADPTIASWSGAPTDSNYNEKSFGGPPGFVDGPGPPDNPNFYRLTQAGVGSTNNVVVWDNTAAGPSSHVIIDIDFRIGGTAGVGNYADGMGIVLLNDGVYGATGPINQNITEEATTAFDSSLGFGLDTFNNGSLFDVSAGLGGSETNELSLHYLAGNGPTQTLFLYAVAMDPSVYNLHQDTINDSGTPFDHLNATVDIGALGATVTVNINRGGTKLTPVNGLLIPGVVPYEMRLGMGGRTGGATDNHDIGTVTVSFAP